MEEEETYEPPKDPDSGEYISCFSGSSSAFDVCVMSGLSLEELGMRALQRLPRDKAIDGILAFNAMRWVPFFLTAIPVIVQGLQTFHSDNLVKYLRPFAQTGQVVKEADVTSFFESLTELAKRGRQNV